MSKELITTNGTAIDYSDPKIVQTLKATVAQGLNEPEFLLFSEYCRASGFNAFRREAWAIKAGGRLQIMTGIGGYWAVANKHPQFDGHEEGYIGKGGEELPDTYPGTDYIGAWCKIYRKDRRFPAKAAVFKVEYDKGVGNWKTMPKVMIMKCAESVAIRKAFPQELNGTYTEEEMPPQFGEPQAHQPVVMPASELPQPSTKRGRGRSVMGPKTPPEALPQVEWPAKETIHDPKEFYYSLAKIEESRRDEAAQFLDKAGATFDPEYNVYVSTKEIKVAREMLVDDPEKDEKAGLNQVMGGDDLPEVEL